MARTTRSRQARRLLVVAAGTALAMTTLVPARATPSPAPGDAGPTVRIEDPVIKGKPCKRKTGVTVVVDFLDLQTKSGRPMNTIKVKCAPGEQPDRITAITAAGFKLETRYGGAFACRIDKKPLPEQSDCLSEGFWLNSHADDRKDDDWEFTGIAPIPAGSFEGWIWTWAGTESDGPRVLPSELRRR